MTALPLALSLLGALGAPFGTHAASGDARKASYDAFLSSPTDRPFDARTLPAALRSRVMLGQVSGTEPRLGVPTFFWAPRAAHPVDLRAEGVTPEQAARRALFDYAGLWRLDGARAARDAVARVHDLGFGAVIVTFTLDESGEEVFRDEVHVVMTQKLELIALSGSFSPVRRPRGAFQLSEGTAIEVAWQDLLGAQPPPPARTDRSVARYHYWALAGQEPVRVKPVYFPLPQGLEPAYYLELHPRSVDATTAPYYSYVVSANDGRLLMRHDLTRYDAFSYRVWADPSGVHLPYDGPQGDDPSPDPTAAPDGYSPAFAGSNLITLANGPISTNDPWLPPGATQSQGNNAFAYADFNTPDGFSSGDVTATPTAAGEFDRTYDLGQNPNVSDDQRMASITQLFFNVNFFHDWYYDLGFDEKSGNGQTDNLGRGGVAGDPVLAEAQDYSGVDNSNMQTPADGASPVMQMYLFDDGVEPTVTVNAPTASTIKGVGGTLGPGSYSVTADLLPVLLNGALDSGCTSVPTATGKIVLLKRGGGCQNTQKAANAEAAGAVGLLIASTGSFVSGPSGTGATIPVVAIANGDGANLVSMAAGATVNLTLSKPPTTYRDGALDNTIVAHEWGHYIQNRLIGNGNGLTNNQGSGMGEGWSDFHAMLMVVREGDDQVATNASFGGVYALASYAMQLLEPRSYYFGIRRVPYSTDLTKDGLTFKHIADGYPLPASVPTSFGGDGTINSEAHDTGEVWATMLWECYASLLRDTGRLTFTQAQTRMRSYIVGGYKATPLNPTVLEARDAILATAEAADEADFKLFVSAFARRGAGLYATGPDRGSTDNNPVSESYADGNGAAIVSIKVDDSGNSCDHDGVLDQGETGVVTVTIKNLGVGDLAATHLAVTTDSPGVAVLSGADFGPLPRLGSATAQVQVRADQLDPRGAVTFTATVSDPSFSSGAQSSSAAVRTDYDVARDSSYIDDVEEPESVWSTANYGDASGKWGITGEGSQHWWWAAGGQSPDDAQLITPSLTVGTDPFVVTFDERWDFEVQRFGQNPQYYDGAVVELSTDDGTTWTDVGASLTPGYGGAIAAGMSANPLAGQQALVAQSQGYPAFVQGKLDFGTTYAGQTVLLRFREGSDDAVGFNGWELDNLTFNGVTNLPFPSLIDDPHACSQPPVVTIDPAQAQVDPGAGVTLTGTVSGSQGAAIVSYSWKQVSGYPVGLTGIGTHVLSFTAPQVAHDMHFVFTLSASDGRSTGVGTADVLVKAPPLPEREYPGKKTGCGCDGVDALTPMFAAAALGLLRRRQRRG